MFNKSTLVLEGVTLAQVVELVVKVLVNLAGSTVLDQQAAEHTKAAHPHNLTVRSISDCPPEPISSCDFDFSTPISFLSHLAPFVYLIFTQGSRCRLTLAYAHQQYPSSYRNHGVFQCGGRQSTLGHGHASAW